MLFNISTEQLAFSNGASTMGCFVAALFFLRFWRTAGDRFFGMFSLAFFLLAVERTVLLSFGSANEVNPAVYLIRCSAFLIIIGAVIDKNRVSN